MTAWQRPRRLLSSRNWAQRAGLAVVSPHTIGAVPGDVRCAAHGRAGAAGSAAPDSRPAGQARPAGSLARPTGCLARPAGVEPRGPGKGKARATAD
jgi:hypothetical protein